MPRFQPQNLDENLRRLQLLKDLAAKKHCSVGHLSLAWVLARADEILRIPSTRRIEHLKENLEALRVELNAGDMRRIDVTLPPRAFVASATRATTCVRSVCESNICDVR